MMDNNGRAARANSALAAWYAAGGDAPNRVRDLLADLMHWCEANGRDFDHELSVARDFYVDETVPECPADAIERGEHRPST